MQCGEIIYVRYITKVSAWSFYFVPFIALFFLFSKLQTFNTEQRKGFKQSCTDISLNSAFSIWPPLASLSSSRGTSGSPAHSAGAASSFKAFTFQICLLVTSLSNAPFLPCPSSAPRFRWSLLDISSFARHPTPSVIKPLPACPTSLSPSLDLCPQF